VIESSHTVVGGTNSAAVAVAVAAAVAVETEKPVADAVGRMLFQKLQCLHLQVFASFPHAAEGVEASVQERFVASSSVTGSGDLVDAAAEDSEITGAPVDSERFEMRTAQVFDENTQTVNYVKTQD
jgi:hypothetical protein